MAPPEAPPEVWPLSAALTFSRLMRPASLRLGADILKSAAPTPTGRAFLARELFHIRQQKGEPGYYWRQDLRLILKELVLLGFWRVSGEAHQHARMIPLSPAPDLLPAPLSAADRELRALAPEGGPISSFYPDLEQRRKLVPLWTSVSRAENAEMIRFGLAEKIEKHHGKITLKPTQKANAWTVEIYARLQAAKAKTAPPSAIHALGGMVVYLPRKHLDAIDIPKGMDAYQEIAKSALYADHQFGALDHHFGGGDGGHGFDGGGGHHG